MLQRRLVSLLLCSIMVGGGPAIGDDRVTRYTDAVYAEFLADCRRKGHPRELCDCMYGYHKERVAFERFQAILAGAEIPHAIADGIAARCGVRLDGAAMGGRQPVRDLISADVTAPRAVERE